MGDTGDDAEHMVVAYELEHHCRTNGWRSLGGTAAVDSIVRGGGWKVVGVSRFGGEGRGKSRMTLAGAVRQKPRWPTPVFCPCEAVRLARWAVGGVASIKNRLPPPPSRPSPLKNHSGLCCKVISLVWPPVPPLLRFPRLPLISPPVPTHFPSSPPHRNWPMRSVAAPAPSLQEALL